MDKLECMRAFKQVVESGGHAAAARKLGLSRSTVNKQVAALEKDLKVQLLISSTRKVCPTVAGMAFYDRCLVLLSDYDDAVSAVSDLQYEAYGKLRVNAPMSFGTLHLSKIIAEFMLLHQSISIELALSDRFVDPIEEGFDVTIRIAEPQPSNSLISKDIAPVKIAMCASPAYLDRFGTPSEPAQLIDHRCLHYSQSATTNHWQLSGKNGEIAVPIQCVMWANNGEVLRDAAINHAGIALVPTFMAGNAFETGELVEVLPDYRFRQDAVISALYPRHRHLSSKVQLFVQFLVERLSFLAEPSQLRQE